ncbi:MAG TPA: hypothetical protein VJ810_18880 [Blastocatellia bacterium]|nr:hypothetical protein [Blastocatellia bacterium]
MKLILFSFAVAIALVIGLVYWYFGPLDPIPRFKASGVCADDGLKITVYQKRISSIPVSRVGVLVRITDPNQNKLFEKIIVEDGWWYWDFENLYTEVKCDKDTISIGPGFDPKDYYKIPRADILRPQ